MKNDASYDLPMQMCHYTLKHMRLSVHRGRQSQHTRIRLGLKKNQ